MSHTSLIEVQQAATALLKNDSTFASLTSGPYNPAPENTSFPYVTWGDHIETPRLVYGPNLGRDVLLIANIWSHENGFLEALHILDAMNGVLDNAVLSLTHFYNVRTLFEWSMQLNDPDGITRHIIARYRVWCVAI